MHRAKHWWSRTPSAVRKPLVLIVGSLFILAAAATGWLPGPGGIPLFLIGVAVLATEFAWAERLRDKLMDIVKHAGHAWKSHKIIGTVILILCAVIAAAIAYSSYQKLGINR
ncbi:MAG: PGPGW domain-containing protein [Patescibacteria group bacterium]